MKLVQNIKTVMFNAVDGALQLLALMAIEYIVLQIKIVVSCPISNRSFNNSGYKFELGI